MRPDLSVFYRSSVGFDRLFDQLDELIGELRRDPGYPPYNIEKTGEDSWRITLAVAGFNRDEITVTSQPGVLVISGKKQGKTETGNFLYQGIAARDFERRFGLAEHVEVSGAALENGLLTIDLVHKVPEALKPRRIEIANTPALEAKAA